MKQQMIKGFIPKNKSMPIEHMNERVVNTLVHIEETYWQNIRYKTMHDFCKNAEMSLSVGSGPKEPIVVNTTHACDIVQRSETELTKNGYKGKFKYADCTNLPYLENAFDAAICSEVIEHLQTEEQIRKTFLELDRVAKKWLVTTPAPGNSTYINEISHNFSFTREKLEELTKGLKVRIDIRGTAPRIYWFIVKLPEQFDPTPQTTPEKKTEAKTETPSKTNDTAEERKQFDLTTQSE